MRGRIHRSDRESGQYEDGETKAEARKHVEDIFIVIRMGAAQADEHAPVLQIAEGSRVPITDIYTIAHAISVYEGPMLSMYHEQYYVVFDDNTQKLVKDGVKRGASLLTTNIPGFEPMRLVLDALEPAQVRGIQLTESPQGQPPSLKSKVEGVGPLVPCRRHAWRCGHTWLARRGR